MQTEIFGNFSVFSFSIAIKQPDGRMRQIMCRYTVILYKFIGQIRLTRSAHSALVDQFSMVVGESRQNLPSGPLNGN